MILILQLIKGISWALQKLLKYFNGTAISAFLISVLLVLPNILDLKMHDSDSVIAALFNGGSSLQNWYKLPHVFD